MGAARQNGKEAKVPAGLLTRSLRVAIGDLEAAHTCVSVTQDGKLQRGELLNTLEAIQVWAAELARRSGGRPIAVALEQSRGAVIAMRCKYAHLVLFSDPP